MTLTTGLAALAIALSATAMPVILDTDLGDDIDDTWALAMLLGSPEFELKLIVTASDNTPVKTRLVAKYLEHAGRTDIPIGTGAKTSDQAINQQDWLGDYTLEDYGGVVHEDGVQALIDCIESAAGPITLLVIGPQTNLKAALERRPSIAEKARVVMMAGSIYKGYGNAPEPAAEWNVVKDAAAAQAVFAAPWEIVMAPLDSCGDLILRGGHYKRVADSAEPRAVALMENYAAWTNRKHYPAGESSVLFDTLAVYLAYDESLCVMETLPLRVDDQGFTRVDAESGRPVRAATGWNDREAFYDLLVRDVTAPRR